MFVVEPTVQIPKHVVEAYQEQGDDQDCWSLQKLNRIQLRDVSKVGDQILSWCIQAEVGTIPELVQLLHFLRFEGKAGLYLRVAVYFEWIVFQTIKQRLSKRIVFWSAIRNYCQPTYHYKWKCCVRHTWWKWTTTMVLFFR